MKIKLLPHLSYKQLRIVGKKVHMSVVHLWGWIDGLDVLGVEMSGG